LLQGAGVAYNRIAGPGAIPGFDNGVMVARINTDIALADFEAGVRNLVWDVEVAYWELYYAYRNLDAMAHGRDAALDTWRKVYAKHVIGARGGELSEVSQARAQYYLFESELQVALDSLYAAERKLRYVMGLAPTDDRLFRPVDKPTTAEWPFAYADLHAETLTRSVELRRQRWNVKLRQLRLISAKNYLLPRLDLSGTYRFLGMGDDLLESTGGTGDFTQFGSNAYQSMTGGDFQEGSLSLNFEMPLGFRKEMAGVKHAQLNLLREKARLQDLELEVVHQLQSAVAELDRHLSLTRLSWQRRVAAQKQLEAVEQQWEIGINRPGGSNVMIDLLLESQRQRVQAESAYFRSLIDYNMAIAQVHFRKNSLLEYDGVYLTEGPWPGKAYFDARRRARARDASAYLDYGFTRPKVVSAGPTQQQATGGLSPIVEDIGLSPQPDSFESLNSLIESESDATPPPTAPAPVPEESAAVEQGPAVKRAGYQEPVADDKMADGAPAETPAGGDSTGPSPSRSRGTWNASSTTSSSAASGWTAARRTAVQR
jgi:outer membrane protein TolC